MHPASELWPAANMLALFRPIGAAKCGLIFPLPIILSDVAAVVAHGRLRATKYNMSCHRREVRHHRCIGDSAPPFCPSVTHRTFEESSHL